MRDFRDAKAMVQTLRRALKGRSVSITHSESLELVAKILGFRDWNILAARIQFESKEFVGETDTATARAAPPPADAGLPLVPLRDLVLFPQMTVPIFVGREKSKRAVERAVSTDRRILAVAQRRALDDGPGLNDLHRVGVTASVIETLTLPDGTLKLFVAGQDRTAVRHFIDGEFLTAETNAVEELRTPTAKAIALAQAVVEVFQTYANIKSGALPQALLRQLPDIRKPGILADTVAPLLAIGQDQKQDLLETADVVARLEKILDRMKTDRQAAQLCPANHSDERSRSTPASPAKAYRLIDHCSSAMDAADGPGGRGKCPRTVHRVREIGGADPLGQPPRRVFGKPPEIIVRPGVSRPVIGEVAELHPDRQSCLFDRFQPGLFP